MRPASPWSCCSSCWWCRWCFRIGQEVFRGDLVRHAGALLGVHRCDHRAAPVLLPPAQPGAVARAHRGQAAGAAGAHPPALPVQQPQRRAQPDPPGAQARRGGARGSGRPVPRADGRQPQAVHARAGSRAHPPVPRPGEAAAGRAPAGRLAHRQHAGRGADPAAGAAAAGGERRLPRHRALGGHGRGQHQCLQVARRGASGAAQPLSQERQPSLRQQDGGRQHPRAPGPALRRRGEPAHQRDRGCLPGPHRHAVSHAGRPNAPS